MAKISFRNWVVKFESVDLPIGDLANDIKTDSRFPKENDKEIIMRYLRNRRACKDAIETFENAWNYYLKSR